MTPAPLADAGYLDSLDLTSETFTVVGYGTDEFVTGSVVSPKAITVYDGARSYKDVSVITTHDLFPDRFVKITESVCFGDSGGPMFHEGTLVALNTWTFSSRCDAPNLQYRVDSAPAQSFLDANLRACRTQHPSSRSALLVRSRQLTVLLSGDGWTWASGDADAAVGPPLGRANVSPAGAARSPTEPGEGFVGGGPARCCHSLMPNRAVGPGPSTSGWPRHASAHTPVDGDSPAVRAEHIRGSRPSAILAKIDRTLSVREDERHKTRQESVQWTSIRVGPGPHSPAPFAAPAPRRARSLVRHRSQPSIGGPPYQRTPRPERVSAVSPSITTSLLDPFVLLERCPSYEATPTSNPSPCGKPVDNSRL